MGRKRKAWLSNSNGRRYDDSERMLPGYYVEWNEYPTPKRRCHRSRNFKTLKGAREFLKQFNNELELAQIASDLRLITRIEPRTLSEAAHEFIEVKSAARTSQTTTSYNATFKYLAHHFGDIEVTEITPAMMDSFVSDRRRSSSEATAAKHWRQARTFFKFCLKRKYCGTNPADDITDRFKSTFIADKHPLLTDGQFRALIRSLDTEDRRLAVQLAGTTGLDWNTGIMKLCWRDIPFDKKVMPVRRRQKTDKHITVPIHNEILRGLRALQIKRGQVKPDSPVFEGLARQHRERNWWHLAVKKAKVPDLKIKDLRVYARHYLTVVCGLPGPQVDLILGHTAQVAHDHYGLVDPKTQRSISRQPLPGSQARLQAKRKKKA